MTRRRPDTTSEKVLTTLGRISLFVAGAAMIAMKTAQYTGQDHETVSLLGLIMVAGGVALIPISLLYRINIVPHRKKWKKNDIQSDNFLTEDAAHDEDLYIDQHGMRHRR